TPRLPLLHKPIRPIPRLPERHHHSHNHRPRTSRPGELHHLRVQPPRARDHLHLGHPPTLSQKHIIRRPLTLNTHPTNQGTIHVTNLQHRRPGVSVPCGRRRHIHHRRRPTHHRPIPVAHRARGGVVGDHPRGRWGEPLRPVLTHPVPLIRRHRPTRSAHNLTVVSGRRIVRVVSDPRL